MRDRNEPRVGKTAARIMFVLFSGFLIVIVVLYYWLATSESQEGIAFQITMAAFALIQGGVAVIHLADIGHELNIYARRNYDRNHGR